MSEQTVREWKDDTYSSFLLLVAARDTFALTVRSAATEPMLRAVRMRELNERRIARDGRWR